MSTLNKEKKNADINLTATRKSLLIWPIATQMNERLTKMYQTRFVFQYRQIFGPLKYQGKQSRYPIE